MICFYNIYRSYTAKRNIVSHEPDEDYGAVHIENEIVDMPLDEFNKQKVEFLKKLNLTQEQIVLLERKTVGQSNCDEWRKERKLRLTASNFGKVAKLKPNTSRANSVKYILYELFHGNAATRLLLIIFNVFLYIIILNFALYLQIL